MSEKDWEPTTAQALLALLGAITLILIILGFIFSFAGTIFMIFSFVAATLFILGLIKPGWAGIGKRKHVLYTYGSVIVAFFILAGIILPPAPTTTAANTKVDAAIAKANKTQTTHKKPTNKDSKKPPVVAKTNDNTNHKSATKPPHNQSKQPIQARLNTKPSGQTKTNSSNATKPATKSSIPSYLIPVTVARHTDGDTLYVTMPNGKEQKLRLLLIDTPEDVDPFKPIEPFSYKAAHYAASKLPIGKHIYIQEGKPGHKYGKYHRMLAYVYITPQDMYNVDVVKKGLARVAYIYPPNTDHLSQLKAAQSYAKSHHLGIWSLSGYVVDGRYSIPYSCHWAAQHHYSTRGCPTQHNKSPPSKKPSSPPTHKSSSGLAIVASTLNVSPGGYASVTIKANPGASASIEVDYKSGPSHASGLGNKTVPSSGKVSWSWKVGSRTTPGNWPVHIYVGSQSVSATLHVQ